MRDRALEDLYLDGAPRGIMGGAHSWVPPPPVEEHIPDFYLMYLAHLDSYWPEETKGEVEYVRLSPGAFSLLSHELQLLEFRKLGLRASTDSELLSEIYPELHPRRPPAPSLTYSIDDPTNLSLLEIIRHIKYLTAHIQHSIRLRSNLLKEAKKSTHNPRASVVTFDANMASLLKRTHGLEQDRKLLLTLNNRKGIVSRRVRLQAPPEIFLSQATLDALATPNPFDEDAESQQATAPASPWRTCRQRNPPAPVIPHSKPVRLSAIANTLTHAAQLNPTTSSPIQFSLIGGYKNSNAEEVQSKLTVCYINIRGLNNTKLDLLLTFIQQLHIDVLVCVDAQLTPKAARALEQRTKQQLGPFSRVHYSSKHHGIIHSHSGKKSKGSPPTAKAGGLFCIVSP